MVKIRSGLLLSAVVMAVFFTGCKSTQAEVLPADSLKTTYVNTKADSNGHVYTSCVFSVIEKVEVRVMGKLDPVILPVKDYSYDESDTRLYVKKLPGDFSGYEKDIIYTVTGVPSFPAVFVLQNYVSKYGKPAIFVEGQPVKEGTDYNFVASSNRIEFLIPVDADKSSYMLCWVGKGQVLNTMSNYMDKYSFQYRTYKSQWEKSVKW